MKKSEIALGIIALISMILNLLLIPGSSLLMGVTLLALSILYMYLSFAIFNKVKLRNIFKKRAYQGISAMRIIGGVLTGLVLSITIIGLLFKFQDYPGATFMLTVGLILSSVVAIVSAIQYSRSKSDYHLSILKRIAVYCGLGLSLILIPKETWVEIKYREYPEYVRAVKKAMEDPENQELWNEVDKERRKMNKR